jgi:serine/threonine protein kinase
MAKDLVKHLLRKNPVQRYDAEKIFSHPWIKCGGAVGMDI